MNGLEISPFIASLPKVELHIHIEGTLTPLRRWTLAQRNKIPLRFKSQEYKTYEELLDSYKVTYNHRPELNPNKNKDVPTFLEAYFAGCEVLLHEQDFYDLAMDYLTRCKEMNVRYAEPFFDIQAHTKRGVAASAVLNGYLRAKQDAETQHGVRSNWIFCFIRDDPVEEGEAAYQVAKPWAHRLFHAVGLASNAYKRPPNLFAQAFKTAQKDGLNITTHCDFEQFESLEHIRQAVFGNGVQRIDHGLDVLDDRTLVQGVVQRGIGLTLCPHAYHRRTATEVLFPKIQELVRQGVKVCINSDDPVYMHDVWIDGNMQKVFTYCDMSKGEMVQLVRNAVDMSWAGKDVKEDIYKQLDVILQNKDVKP